MTDPLSREADGYETFSVTAFVVSGA